MKTLQFKRFGNCVASHSVCNLPNHCQVKNVLANWNVLRHFESVLNARAFSSFATQTGVCCQVPGVRHVPI